MRDREPIGVGLARREVAVGEVGERARRSRAGSSCARGRRRHDRRRKRPCRPRAARWLARARRSQVRRASEASAMREGASARDTLDRRCRTTRRSIVTAGRVEKANQIMLLRIVCICVALVHCWHAAAAADATPSAEPVRDAAQCIACHSQLTAPSGDDVSIGFDWRATMMANSARDPYWHAAVRREVLDHPTAQAAIEDKCSTCHMPMARFDAAAAGVQRCRCSRVSAARRRSTRSRPTACHARCAIRSPPRDSASTRASTAVSRSRRRPMRRVAFGPHEVDAGRQAVMRSAGEFTPSAGAHMQQSELCATCHTLYTTALDEARAGDRHAAGAGAVSRVAAQRLSRDGELPELPHARGRRRDADHLGARRNRGRGMSQHTFLGGNAFMLGMLNRYRGELGVTALPQELDSGGRTRRAITGLASAAIADRSPRPRARCASLDVRVDMAARRATSCRRLIPRGAPGCMSSSPTPTGRVVFESGAMRPDGRSSATTTTPTPRVSSRTTRSRSAPDQVQIYESIMVDRARRGDDGTAARRALRQGQPAAAARLRQDDGRGRRRRARRSCGRRGFRRRRRPRALSRRADRAARARR